MSLIKVAVRKKPISKGRHSVYLDFWPPIPHPRTGKPSRREFLGLYVYDSPSDSLDLKHNKEVMHMAQAMRNRRVYELNRAVINAGSAPEKRKAGEILQQDFLAYFRSMAEDREGKDRGIWISALRYLKKYAKGPLPFAELNEQKTTDFKEYLESRYLSQSTKATYFTKFRAALKQAYREDLLQEDLNAKISGIKVEKTARTYLTMDELNKLAATPCKDVQFRRAGLFSALTGLRFIDMQQLTWLEVHRDGELHYLKLRQEDSDKREKHPISKQAYELLGPTGGPMELVFQDLHKTVYNNTTLSDWLKDAGINKKMNFQGFRHSFAVNQLFLGTDIYTVSKMLGHQDLKSTLVYAKIADELKFLAADRIKLDI
jgi:site-specific recombinase XerD